VVFQSLIWANFDSFGQLWADSAGLGVVENMPELGLKS
jgi:hypothetical protein